VKRIERIQIVVEKARGDLVMIGLLHKVSAIQQQRGDLCDSRIIRSAAALAGI